MAFFKVTYSEKHRAATVYNTGCALDGAACGFRLVRDAARTLRLSEPRPPRPLRVPEICQALQRVDARHVCFVGGDPALARELPELLIFAKRMLRASTYLGCTGGTRLPLEHLDGANVSLKAWDEKVHMAYAGSKKWTIFGNFAACVRMRMNMRANVTLIPGLVEVEQIEAIARWIAQMDRTIPLQVVGYFPVPGQSYRRAGDWQMVQAVQACQSYLQNVEMSYLSSEDERAMLAPIDPAEAQQIA